MSESLTAAVQKLRRGTGLGHLQLLCGSQPTFEAWEEGQVPGPCPPEFPLPPPPTAGRQIGVYPEAWVPEGLGLSCTGCSLNERWLRGISLLNGALHGLRAFVFKGQPEFQSGTCNMQSSPSLFQSALLPCRPQYFLPSGLLKPMWPCWQLNTHSGRPHPAGEGRCLSCLISGQLEAREPAGP